ncbi:MAG: hypothetical protein AAGI38_24995, partial [Bacteroidota bacterium]
YGLFGRKTAGYISRVSVVALLFFGGTGLMDMRNFLTEYWSIGLYVMLLAYVYNRLIPDSDNVKVVAAFAITIAIQALIKWFFPDIRPNLIWLIYAVMAVRFIGLNHPPAIHEHSLSTSRKALGWFALVIFVLCFTPEPIILVG